MNHQFAKQIGEYLVLNLKEHCRRIEIAGSVRRQKCDCGDLELVCIPAPGAPRPEFGQRRVFTTWLDLALFQMECNGRLGSRIKDGEKYKQIVIKAENFGLRTLEIFKLDLFIVTPETWGVQFAIRTGPADFSHKFVTKQSQGGWLPNHMQVDGGLLQDTTQQYVIPTLEETDLFEAIGMPWIEPQDRQAYYEKNKKAKLYGATAS